MDVRPHDLQQCCVIAEGGGLWRGKGSDTGQSCTVKGDRNKMGTFYDIKVCLFTKGSDSVLRVRFIMQGQKGTEKIFEKTWGVRPGQPAGFSLGKGAGLHLYVVTVEASPWAQIGMGK